MKLNKFAYLYSKPLGNHTLKIMKKYLEIYFKKPGKIMEISWNFVSPKKWEPCMLQMVTIAEILNVLRDDKMMVWYVRRHLIVSLPL